MFLPKIHNLILSSQIKYFSNIIWLSLIFHDADGRGSPLNAKTKVCPTCRGIGRVSFKDLTDDGYGDISSERSQFVRIIIIIFSFLSSYKSDKLLNCLF